MFDLPYNSSTALRHVKPRALMAAILFPCLVLLPCLGLASSGEPSTSRSTIWVGGDGQCDFNSLAAALDAAESGDQLNLAANRSYSNATYSVSKSLTLLGGWEECHGALTAGSTALSGGLSDRVMDVFNPNPAAELEVQITGIDFGGGSTGTNGGGLNISGNHEVLVTDSLFGLNSADGNGGAVSVSNGAVVEFNGDIDIAINSADGNGGGVACSGATIQFNQGSKIRNNNAENGGGIAADDCEIRFHSGGPGFQGIRDNSASEDGGGIHAVNSSTLLLDGAESTETDASLPVLVRGNESGSFGGGIYLDNSSHEATLINTIVEENESGSGAAAIRVGFGASLTMSGNTDVPCAVGTNGAGPRTCSKLRGNIAHASIGNIVSGTNSSEIDIRKTEIRDNVIDSGGIIRVTRSNLLFLENVLFSDNVTDASGTNVFLIRLSGDATNAVIRWTTFANHQGTLSDNTLIDLFGNSAGEPELGLEGLVIDQPGATVVGVRGSGEPFLTRAACIVAPEIDSLETYAGSNALVGNLTAADPMLIDPDAGNYRLSSNSPAIDGCLFTLQPQPLVPPERDLDGFDRGIANSEAGQDTPFDLGAFERAGEILLHDRFEQN